MDINGINYEENGEVSHLLPPGTMLRNQYRIESVLGEGGFGITYRATDTMLELPVAVKEFYPVGSNRVVKYSCSVSYKTGMTERYSVSKNRFLDEARMLAKCDSIPGIVRVLAYFEENNTAYIVMEFLDGVSLEKYVKDNGVMKAEELIPKMLPLIKALSRVHEMDYIHRDISPNNIMLRPDGSLTLYDFGTAKEANYRDLHTMTTMQKVGFTPYEQLNSHGKQGSWTDVYALCGTMYYCLTGQIPPDAIDRVLDSALPVPKDITVPKEVWKVITAGMEPQTENRLQNMNELSRELEKDKTHYRPVEGDEELYKRALALLEKKDYKSALKIFGNIAGYRDSKDYIALCQKEISKLENDTTEKIPKPIKKPLVIAALIAAVLAAALMIIPKQRNDIGSALKNAEVGDIVTFGAYEQDNDTSNGKEDIEWQVLDKENNKLLVISKYALDCQQYNTKSSDVTWESCTLRKWLNDSFLNTAFSSEEQKLIMQTAVSADPNPEFATDSGNTTEDKLFLLSINEVNEYFTNDEARKCAPTAYAKAQGAFAGRDIKTASGEDACWWWLRSPGNFQDTAAFVDRDSSVRYHGNHVDRDSGCVRPAMWINLNS